MNLRRLLLYRACLPILLATLLSNFTFAQKASDDPQEILQAGCDALSANNTKLAIRNFEEAISKISERDAKQLASFYKQIGRCYMRVGADDEAEYYLLLASEKSFLAKDSTLYSTTLIQLSFLYGLGGIFHKESEMLERALPFINKFDSAKLVTCYSTLADCYNRLNQPFRSISYSYQAKGYNEANDLSSLATIHHNLCDGFIRIQRFDSAYANISKALAIDLQLQDTFNLIWDYWKLGDYYHAIGNYKVSSSAYQKSLGLHRKFGFIESAWDYGDYIACLDSLASNYKYEGKLDSAFIFERQVKEVVSRLLARERARKNDIRSTIFNERLSRLVTEKEQNRKISIQYYSIFIGLIILVMVYLAFSKYDKTRKYTRYISIFILLLIFEFLLVLFDPALEFISSGNPLYKLALNMVIGLLIIPVHRLGEKIFNRYVVDVKIRDLDASE